MAASQATGAASFFHVESPHIIRNLKERLLKKRNELAEFVATGGCLSSFENYHRYVGQMAGLLDAVDMIDELEKQERN